MVLSDTKNQKEFLHKRSTKKLIRSCYEQSNSSDTYTKLIVFIKFNRIFVALFEHAIRFNLYHFSFYRIVTKLIYKFEQAQLIGNLYLAILPTFKSFVLVFEQKNPQKHRLYDELVKVLLTFFQIFLKFKSLVNVEGAQLLKLNSKDHVRPKRDIFVGAATKHLLLKLKKDRKKDFVEDFLDKVKNAFVETGTYNREKFPLANSLLEKLSALDLIARGHTVTHQYLSDLPTYFPTIMSEENEDAYLQEIMEYQTADLPPPTATINEEVLYVPLDEWWAKVFETGKFPVLEKLVTVALSIFTEPQVEASFSLMKHIIHPNTNRTCFHTYSSIMDIKYHILSTGKTSEKLFHRKDFNRDQVNPCHSYYIPTAHSSTKRGWMRRSCQGKLSKSA